MMAVPLPDWYIERLDEEYREPVREIAANYPAGLAEMDVDRRRTVITARALAMRPTDPDGVSWQDHVAQADGRQEVPVRIYRYESASQAPTLFYIHGGGMWSGSIDIDHAKVAQMCADLKWTIISLDYRRAPEHPHPLPLDDCVTVYLWLLNDGASHGVDITRLALGGLSAGGGLALATALWLRDHNKSLPQMLMLQCPMVDDTNSSSSINEFDDLGPLFWDKTKNVEAWGWYLGGKQADGYASPLRMRDLSGLPSTFIDVGELDPFFDEDVELAHRLRAAGVPIELHTYSGLGHATEYLVPDAELSREVQKRRRDALHRAVR